MQIKAVILRNFRSYRDETIIPIAGFTGFIGRNDVGKSTILEALDIFFEGGVVSIGREDACITGHPREVTIGVIFSDLPATVVLDSNAPTTFAAEHLLNADGDLEIRKIFNCSNSAPKPQVFAKALHPTANDVENILQNSQSALRNLVRDRMLTGNCELNSNPSMRRALYADSADLAIQLCDVPLNEENGKAIWSALQSYLPIFALFQSDRSSNDQDSEVQNPMKLAVEQALSEVEQRLNDIIDTVQARAQETADRTVEKLNEKYPDIASTLVPKFKRPTWKSIFKMDLEADDGIALNKRGSGVRRLVLLSFFQAEAEKRREEANAGTTHRRNVVYAIEEPETSQHPDNQQMIINALKSIAASGDQVIVTTHVPALAALMPIEGLRFIVREAGSTVVRMGNDGVYQDIANTLGVLPDPLNKNNIKVAVLVEGKTDIDALRAMISVLTNEGVIPEINDDYIFWTIGGGDSTLMDWVERRYLDRLGVPQVMIQDSDLDIATGVVSPVKLAWLHSMQARQGVTAFLTRKRCIENYLHPDTINRVTAGNLIIPAATDLDHVKLPSVVWSLLKTARAAGYNLQPIDDAGLPITGKADSLCKKIICSYLMRHMTSAEINSRASYNDNGTSGNEVLDWINAIRSAL